jgi:hypothetical protein
MTDERECFPFGHGVENLSDYPRNDGYFTVLANAKVDDGIMRKCVAASRRESFPYVNVPPSLQS